MVSGKDPVETILESVPATAPHARMLTLKVHSIAMARGLHPTIAIEDVARELAAEIAIAGVKIRDLDRFAGSVITELLIVGRIEAKRAEREARAPKKASDDRDHVQGVKVMRSGSVDY